MTPRKRPVTCLHVDAGGHVLWVGDAEGCVSGYDIGGEPGMSVGPAQRLHVWQAFRVGQVTTICVTPAGEVWTGSSRGHIRVWTLGRPASYAGEEPEPPMCRELRRAGGERPHNSAVGCLVCDATGQLVWSTTAFNLLLWDAASGAFLGMLQRPKASGDGGGGGVPSEPPSASKYRVDPKKGLEVDPLSGTVVACPTPAGWATLRAEQEAWAAATDTGVSELMERVSIGGGKVVQGVGKAVKFIGERAPWRMDASASEVAIWRVSTPTI